jgi:hypothetical protein
LAHATGSRPRGSIGSPPERGAEAYAVWSGHVLALDPRLALIKAWVFFVPESRDLDVSVPDPPQRGLGPVPGVRARPWRFWTLPGGPVRTYRGPALSHGGPDPLLISWSISSSLATWRPGSHPCGGSGAVYHATRDSRMGTVPSHYSKGYPCFKVPTVAPGPTSREDTSLQVGPKPGWRLVRRFRALADVITASPPSVTPTATSVPAAD